MSRMMCLSNQKSFLISIVEIDKTCWGGLCVFYGAMEGHLDNKKRRWRQIHLGERAMGANEIIIELCV